MNSFNIYKEFQLKKIINLKIKISIFLKQLSESSNSVDITGNTDRIIFHSYFSFKDLITIYLFFILFAIIIFYISNKLRHNDNYIEVNNMQISISIERYIIFNLFFFNFEIFSIFIILFLYDIFILIYISFFQYEILKTNCFYIFKRFYSYILYYQFNIIDNTKLDKEDWFKLIKKEEENVNSDSILEWDSKFFKYLSNDIFQIEDHINDYFLSNKNNKFRSLVFIELMTDIESVKNFVFLNKKLNNKMKYFYSLNFSYSYQQKNNINSFYFQYDIKSILSFILTFILITKFDIIIIIKIRRNYIKNFNKYKINTMKKY